MLPSVFVLLLMLLTTWAFADEEVIGNLPLHPLVPITGELSSITVFPEEERKKHCKKMNITPGRRCILREVYSYSQFEDPPILEIFVNSMLLHTVDTSKDSILHTVLGPLNCTMLEFCLTPTSNVTTGFMSRLALFLYPEWRTNTSFRPARKLLDARSHSSPSVLAILSAALGSLAILTMVVSLCIFKLFRALHSPPPVRPQSPPKYEKRLEIVIEPKIVKQFTLKDLEEAIGTRIAEGGFGYVYRGRLPNNQEVAVKVRSSTSTQGLREFTAELTHLSQLTHDNLVPLLGYCTEGQQEMLVYPYMSNGTLQDRLYGEASKRKPLDWKTRLSIALGAARGLNFLHKSRPRPIIHRDVKSSNILLDDSMNARLADFGFSRFAPQDDDSLVSVEVRGTTGYLDPEYYTTQMLTTKSDVFSFGVVLLEIICGREPLNLRRPRSEASLVDWARKSIDEANIQAIIDPTISTSYTPEAMWRVLEVAYSSVEPSSARRHDMASIVRELDDALIIENNASQYMLSLDSISSFRRSTSIKLNIYPSTVPFDPSPALSETLDSPHPR